MNNSRLVILGAGRSRDGGQQASLRQITADRGSVLEWQLHALSSLVDDIDFVGGFHIDRIIRRFPQLTYHYNSNWAETGPVESLRQVLDVIHIPQDIYVSYGDILMRRALAQELADPKGGSLSLALEIGSCDSLRPLRDGRLPESLRTADTEGELIGILHVPVALFECFRTFVQNEAPSLSTAGLSELLRRWIARGENGPTRIVPAQGRWAHLEDDRSIAQFILGTKAATLAQLRGELSCSEILPQVTFRRGAWSGRREALLDQIRSELRGPLLAVRSSAADEDSFVSANAGRYATYLNVPCEAEALAKAVSGVFASYDAEAADDEVLIQPMLDHIQASGVIVTRTLGSCAPYYVLNFTEDGDTTAVTGGVSKDARVLTVARSAPAHALSNLPEKMQAVLVAVKEIEAKVSYDRLDIEFAVDDEGSINVLQVRPLVADHKIQDLSLDGAVDRTLAAIHESVRFLEGPSGKQVGGRTCWSTMADWNPAEIVGTKPSPLSIDLYRYVITDATWARQRHAAGYRDITGWPLIRNFGGQPFIDVRASLNSFIPAALPDETACRVIDWGIRRLREVPALHDKIEFEIIPTCLDFEFPRWKERYLADGVLNAEEIQHYEQALQELTNGILARTLNDLNHSRNLECNSDASDVVGATRRDRIRQLLKNCRDEGALTFAHLARSGFVAVALLKSAVVRGYLAPDRYDALLRSVSTIGSRISDDAWQVKSGRLKRSTFVTRYGHLRPGTYDISSPTYASHPELFLDAIIDRAERPERDVFEWTEREANGITRALGKTGLELTADTFLEFIHNAIAGREYSKFVFTKQLSKALELLAEEAESFGLDSSQFDFLPLAPFLEIAGEVWDRDTLARSLVQQTEERMQRHQICSLINLPPLIFDADDIYVFERPQAIPNYVTAKSCTGELLVLTGAEDQPSDIGGKIVAIENADPGYDYLFAIGIKGFISAYGGPNSHMAIRASEFGLPAIIGIGEMEFTKLRTGMIVEIDCHKQVFRIT